jgi:hypothetical protein
MTARSAGNEAMARITYFVALPFEYNGEGELVAGEAREAQTEGGARRMASTMAAAKAGAIAFCRTGDPSIGSSTMPSS